MNRLLAKGLLITAFLVSSTYSAAFALDPIHPYHQWLMNNKGQVVIFRGFNLVIKNAQSAKQAGFDERHAKFIHDHGFNLIRLGLLWANIEPELGHFNMNYLADMKQTVRLLASQQIYSLIDIHEDQYSQLYGDGAPAWATIQEGTHTPDVGFPCNLFATKSDNIRTDINHAYSAFWENKKLMDHPLQEAYLFMLQKVVAYFKSEHNNLFGYDIMNEPYMGLSWPTCVSSVSPLKFGKDCQQFDTVLTTFYQAATLAIHKEDPTVIAWYESNLLVGLGAPILLGKVNDPYSAMSFHNYDAATDYKGPIDYALNYQKKFNVPIFEGEYGATTDVNETEKMLIQNNNAMVSSTYWAYFNNPTFHFCSTNNLPADPRRQAIVMDLTKPLDASNVNEAMLAMLTEVYPRAISGTPLHFSYDHHTKIFNMDYSPINPEGKTPAAPTEIVVPSSIYPQGYQVELKNSVQISAKNSPILLISSKPGSKDAIHITIRPRVS